jgi:hypothetical protein
MCVLSGEYFAKLYQFKYSLFLGDTWEGVVNGLSHESLPLVAIMGQMISVYHFINTPKDGSANDENEERVCRQMNMIQSILRYDTLKRASCGNKEDNSLRFLYAVARKILNATKVYYHILNSARPI